MKNKEFNENEIDFYNLNMEKKVEYDIDEYIKYFVIDNSHIDSISIPKDINKVVKLSFNEIKKGKSINIKYMILDMILVGVILLPLIGVIKPNIFLNIPNVYPIFKNINEFIQMDNIKRVIGMEEKEVIEGSTDSKVATIYIEEKDVITPKSNNEAIKLIHSLANGLVQAEYKWQCSEVTPKTIQQALEGVEKINDNYDRMHLRNCLTKWKNGDFSNAVDVHNYVWEMLDGNIGKAEKLDEEKIKAIMKSYY